MAAADFETDHHAFVTMTMAMAFMVTAAQVEKVVRVYFGNGPYGVEAVSLGYFGKHVQDQLSPMFRTFSEEAGGSRQEAEGSGGRSASGLRISVV